jgi:hypothetical protein
VQQRTGRWRHVSRVPPLLSMGHMPRMRLPPLSDRSPSPPSPRRAAATHVHEDIYAAGSLQHRSRAGGPGPAEPPSPGFSGRVLKSLPGALRNAAPLRTMPPARHATPTDIVSQTAARYLEHFGGSPMWGRSPSGQWGVQVRA